MQVEELLSGRWLPAWLCPESDKQLAHLKEVVQDQRGRLMPGQLLILIM